jgi:D-alanyl-D-alanine carboxypeptidase
VTVSPSYDVLLTRPHRAVALRSTTLTGRVSTLDGAHVSIKVQRAVDASHWRPVATTHVRSNGTFQHGWLPNTRGWQRLRAIAVWSNGHRDISPTLRVRISARFDPVVTKITRKDVPHTYHRGCPVGPSSLRKIQLTYWDYDKQLQRGTLIGAVWAVNDYKYFFKRAFQTKFLIEKMYPADRYGGNDKRAMRAGDTSAFNCRHVTGNPYQISEHSYGDAIDINTFQNPYVTSSHVYPPAAAQRYYRHRSQHLRDPGVISRRSTIARAMFKRGWQWGARWANPDYQHWSINGG